MKMKVHVQVSDDNFRQLLLIIGNYSNNMYEVYKSALSACKEFSNTQEPSVSIICTCLHEYIQLTGIDTLRGKVHVILSQLSLLEMS